MKNKSNKCPYNDLPPKSFFPQLENANGDLFLQPEDNFQIDSKDKIISFGSCFASKIPTICKKLNLNYLKKEDLNIINSDKIRIEKDANFSLNYGNIYTAKHFFQLMQRVLKIETRLPRMMSDQNNRLRNSFRPNVLSYDTETTLRNDDSNHLCNIYNALKDSNILILTLGLTEHWIDKETTLCLPQTPGCGIGEFIDSDFEFKNSELSEVVNEIKDSILLLKQINKNLSVILTISPVPLVATFTNMSAVEANIYSKSLLRHAVSLIMQRNHLNLYYFPSFEIMTNPHFLNLNFESNKRAVSNFGLNSITNNFNQKYVGRNLGELNEFDSSKKIEVAFNEHEKNFFNPSCDEENMYSAYLEKNL